MEPAGRREAAKLERGRGGRWEGGGLRSPPLRGRGVSRPRRQPTPGSPRTPAPLTPPTPPRGLPGLCGDRFWLSGLGLLKRSLQNTLLTPQNQGFVLQGKPPEERCSPLAAFCTRRGPRGSEQNRTDCCSPGNLAGLQTHRDLLAPAFTGLELLVFFYLGNTVFVMLVSHYKHLTSFKQNLFLSPPITSDNSRDKIWPFLA